MVEADLKNISAVKKRQKKKKHLGTLKPKNCISIQGAKTIKKQKKKTARRAKANRKKKTVRRKANKHRCASVLLWHLN